MLRNFLQDEDGATAIEYGLIAALISVAIIAGIEAIGGELADTFDTIDSGLEAANS